MNNEFTVKRDYFDKTTIVGYVARFDSAAAAYPVACRLIAAGIACQPKLDNSIYVPMHNKGLQKKHGEFLELCALQGFKIVGGAA